MKYYPIVTLCGSTKFKEDFLRLQEELTLSGFCVISVGIFEHADHDDTANNPITSEMKKMIDEIQLQKIDLASRVMIVNRDDYIGESTKAQIEYAKKIGKPIFYMYPHKE